MRPEDRIVITGIGLTAPNGNSLAEFRKNLLDGVSGVQRFETRFMGEVLAGVNDGFVGAGPDIGAVELGGETPMACAVEGMTRPCGVGACAGTQTCIGGIWTECDGAAPTDEVCGNGVDDDCDGETDEGDCSSRAASDDGGCGCTLPGPDRTRLRWLAVMALAVGTGRV